MYKDQFRQKCRKCGGSGVNNKKELVDKDDQTVLAPIYTKGEAPRPQYANCTECKGSGLTMQDSPKEVLHEGVKVPLEDADRRARFNDAPLSMAQ